MENRPNEKRSARDDAWAKPVDKFKINNAPAGSIPSTVNGLRLTGPIRGFGQMWQKTYRARLGARVKPVEAIRAWKENFPKFWPKGNTFYPSLAGIKPGEIGLITTSGPGNVPMISTGVMVIYADDESFSFMTPEGHPFAGMVTFSAAEEDGETIAQAQVLIRPNDPIYELTFRVGIGHKMEDDTWHHTLKSLAAHFNVQTTVEQKVTLVDPRVQWKEAKNIWHNAGMRTAIYTLMTPARWVRGLFGKK